MTDPDASISVESAVGAVVEAFLVRFRSGERPSLPELMALHPDLADQLQELIPALVEMEQFGDLSGSQSRPGLGRAAGAATDHPDSLGDYRILRRIGGGGMGEVFEAEHHSLKSRVALKLMQRRFRNDPKFLRRFHLEARSAARLHHTNIVTVFDYGEEDGLFYYAMQFIDGQSLDNVLHDLRLIRSQERNSQVHESLAAWGPATDRSKRLVAQSLIDGQFPSNPALGLADMETRPGGETSSQPLARGEIPTLPGSEAGAGGEATSPGSSSLEGTAERRYYLELARIGAQVADALDYAHRAGVLHRDIKPSNLLLDASGNVWVTDFGLAKLVDGEDASGSADLVGTFRYMAPERFRRISDRSGGGDIYALGATLYELATLRPVFQESDPFRLMERIIHVPPDAPRVLDRRIPRDLETIVLKALAKNPKDRFRSAGEMAKELRLFARGFPIASRPISPLERSFRWCRRNPKQAAATIIAGVTTLALAMSSTIAAKILYDGRERSLIHARDLEAAETQGRMKLFDARAAQASASRFSRRAGQRFESLAALAEAVKIGRDLGFPAGRFDPLRDEAIASLLLPDVKPVRLPIPTPETYCVSAFDEGMTRYALRTLDGSIVVRRFNDDGEIARFAARAERDVWVHALSPDGKYLASRDGETVSIWDVDRGTHAWSAPGKWSANFSPDSRKIAIATGDFPVSVNVRDLKTGKSQSWGSEPPWAENIVFRPDSGAFVVAYSGNPSTYRVVDASTGRTLQTIRISGGGRVAWSPDGSTLAIAEGRNKVGFYDVARGVKGATAETPLEGNSRLGFHPDGTLLAVDDGFDGIQRFFDPATGRERLSLSGAGQSRFSKDGRMLVRGVDRITPCRVEPALEYTTLSYPAGRILGYERVSVHRDGRILAVGTDGGVILWDMARRVELGFLPIGLAWHSAFEPSGDLITNGTTGVLRWPVQDDPAGGAIRIGPPRVLFERGTNCGIAFDSAGKVVAVAGHQESRVVLDDRTISIGPLDDCRFVSLSPDGRWLTTNNHQVGGVTIWSLPDGARVARLPIEGKGDSKFSPDGKWLASISQGSTWILEVGTWREVRRIEAQLLDFSPDGQLAIFRDSSQVLKLVEHVTGRLLARIERPDLQVIAWAAFSPDASRLLVTTNAASTQVIDLRLIRRRLSELGLDWDAPAYAEVDSAHANLPHLPPLAVDYGPLSGHLDQDLAAPGPLVERYTGRIRDNANDWDAYHKRAHALANLDRRVEAVADLSRAITLRPDDPGLWHDRGRFSYEVDQGRPERAIPDLEQALVLKPSLVAARELLATCCNNVAWELAKGVPSDQERALGLARRAVELAPGQQMYLNTLGVILHRAGRFAEAVTILERSLEAGRGQFEGFDLYFLAMSHDRLGHRDEARRLLNRANAWVARTPGLSTQYVEELTSFRTEAEAGLARPLAELPDDVFAGPGLEDRPARP